MLLLVCALLQRRVVQAHDTRPYPTHPHRVYSRRIDYTLGYSEYHFSWRHDGGHNYPWNQANAYCSQLGPGWEGVSIESVEEDKFISSVVGGARLRYIWTGGFFKDSHWKWTSGERFLGLNWSHTGGLGKNQPDNREDGKEFCLAVLNNFYHDGITWHDVACHHEKPIICERRRDAHFG